MVLTPVVLNSMILHQYHLAYLPLRGIGGYFQFWKIDSLFSRTADGHIVEYHVHCIVFHGLFVGVKSFSKVLDFYADFDFMVKTIAEDLLAQDF